MLSQFLCLCEDLCGLHHGSRTLPGQLASAAAMQIRELVSETAGDRGCQGPALQGVLRRSAPSASSIVPYCVAKSSGCSSGSSRAAVHVILGANNFQAEPRHLLPACRWEAQPAWPGADLMGNPAPNGFTLPVSGVAPGLGAGSGQQAHSAAAGLPAEADGNAADMAWQAAALQQQGETAAGRQLSIAWLWPRVDSTETGVADVRQHAAALPQQVPVLLSAGMVGATDFCTAPAALLAGMLAGVTASESTKLMRA